MKINQLLIVKIHNGLAARLEKGKRGQRRGLRLLGGERCPEPRSKCKRAYMYIYIEIRLKSQANQIPRNPRK